MTGSRGKTSEEIYGMSAEDATTLFELRRIFEHNYRITFTDGIWTASRLGLWRTATVITADSAPKLRGLIGEDLRLWAAEARKHQ